MVLLQKIAKAEGFSSVEALLQHSVIDSVCPAICTDCHFICDSEPDATENYCEACGGQTVKSALIIAGLI